MDTFYRISKTDLARKTHQIIRNVQRGQMAIVESHGQAEAAIMDIIDYRILRAMAAYSSAPSASDFIPDEQAIRNLADEQERYDQVLSAYLAEAISLARAAELLDLPVIDLRFRFARLDVPLRLGTATEDEAAQEIEQAADWTLKNNR